MSTALPAGGAAGIDPAAIRAFVEAAEQVAELHTLAISHRGTTVAQAQWAPYSLDRPQLVYSVSKTITAMTVGALLHQDGGASISLDDPILDHLPAPGITPAPAWHDVTIEHCLAMATGHTADAWNRAWAGPGPLPAPLLDLMLATPPQRPPGTVFAYNQVATNLLSRMVTHVTGAPLRRVAHERVLGPLGLPEPGWFTDATGIDQGWSGAHVRTGDLLTLGRFWLRDGCTEDGTRLLPGGFLDRATTPFAPLPEAWTRGAWTRGYGYSFWILDAGFRADGAFGQFAVVLPAAELVVAITSISTDMHGLGELILTHLLPGVGREPAPEDASLAAFLADRSLPLLPAAGTAPAGLPAWHPLAPPAAVPVAGAPPAAPSAPPPDATDVPVAGFDAVSLPAPGEPLRLRYAGTELALVVPTHSWGETVLRAPAGPYAGTAVRVLAQGGWSDGTYRARLRIPSFPHHVLVTGDAASASVVWPIAPLNGADLFAASPERAGLSA
ncbi:serine hydrolase [Pseudactinotalea sp. HY160]|uniref:serine hydrolase domain-containing protein n=1 Tax=Pseudactinotalea sp. HY160 TaxID=2654490 RepID=UPI00128B207D|nr:serine hydrolase [Pseudactinotalea sp. HY160]